MFAIIFVITLIVSIPIIIIGLRIKKNSSWLRNGLLGLGVGAFFGLMFLILFISHLLPFRIFESLVYPICPILSLITGDSRVAKGVSEDCLMLALLVFPHVVIIFYGMVGLMVGLIITIFKKR